jgi:hypothetical protein
MAEYPDTEGLNKEEEAEDILEENVEAQNEAQEEYSEDNSPTYSKQEDLYSLFWKTIRLEDSSKVGNLDYKELGMLDISVRDCQHIAFTADILGEKEFAKWIREQAQIILRTSSSKKDWLVELFVSAKRFASKEKKLGIGGGGTGENANKPKSFWEKIKGK